MTKTIFLYFKGKRSLRVISTATGLPDQLTLVQRLIYSFMVQQEGYNKNISVRGIAKALRISRETVSDNLQCMLGLVELTADGWSTIAPLGSDRRFLLAQGRENESWGLQFAYWHYFLPASQQISTINNAVFWLLWSMATMHFPYASYPALKHQTASGIATMLNVDSRSVAKALNWLQDVGLILRTENRTTLLQPTDEHLALWLDKKSDTSLNEANFDLQTEAMRFVRMENLSKRQGEDIDSFFAAAESQVPAMLIAGMSKNDIASFWEAAFVGLWSLESTNSHATNDCQDAQFALFPLKEFPRMLQSVGEAGENPVLDRLTDLLKNTYPNSNGWAQLNR